MTTTFDPHTNLGITAVTVAPSSPGVSTTMTLAKVSHLTDPASGQYNMAVCPPGVLPDLTNSEIVRFTAINYSTKVVTMIRTQESTSARLISISDLVWPSWSKKVLTDIEGAINTLETGVAEMETDITDLEAAIAGLSGGNPLFANVLDYGAVGNGSTNDRTAIHNADVVGIGVFFPGGKTYKITTSLTIAGMCMFGEGAKITVPTGQTITFSGDIIAPLQQLFVLAGTAAIAFGNKVRVAQCEWFGAGMGVSDDLAACTLAANACIVNHRPLRLDTNLSACPSAAFVFTDAIQFDAPSDILISGSGAVNCFVFKAGGHVRVNLPSIYNFPGSAITQDGTGGSNLPFWEVNCNYINHCGTAVYQHCDAGSLLVDNAFNIYMVNDVTNVWYQDGTGVTQGSSFSSNIWILFHYGLNIASANVSCDGLIMRIDSIDQDYQGVGAWVYTPLQNIVRLDFHQGGWGGNNGGWVAGQNKVLSGGFASCHFHFAPQSVGGGAIEFWDPRLWVDFVNGGAPNYMELQGSTTWLVNTTAASYTITEFDSCFLHFFLECNCSSNAITVTLPAPNGSTKQITVMKTDGTGNLVTIQRVSVPYVIHGVGLVGATSFNLAASQMAKATLLGPGSNYHAILYKD